MAIARETAMVALSAAIEGAVVPLGASYERGAAWPERVPPGGRVILRDGEPGEPIVTMSPARWSWDYRAEVEIWAEGGDRFTRAALLLEAIADALAADPTLGGTVSHAEAGAYDPTDQAPTGAAATRAVSLPVVLTYTSTSSLG
ncbi:acyl-CoA transferase [Tistrella bauzanensis]|uniref:acyl-CoA transferase n=1 Tax=Tistrella TaxID=171436 RepID=UPI0031F7146C